MATVEDTARRALHIPGSGDAIRREAVRVEGVIRRVKRTCEAGLDSVTLRRELATRLAPVLGFDAHAFSTCDPDTGLISHTVAAGLPEDVARRYVEHLHPRFCARLAMGERDVDCTTLRPVDPWNRARPASVEVETDARLHIALAADGRLWGTWLLLRDGCSPTDAARARMLLARLVPHLVRGLQAAALSEHGRSASLATGDAEPGVLVLDACGRATMRTPAAALWLADLADDGLRMPDDIPLAVLALAGHARRVAADGRSAVRLRARGRSGRSYLVRASLAEAGADGERPAVVVVRPVTTHEAATIRTQSYGLSAREREVIAALARGASTKEIAAALGRSPHTVREHIERACQKIGVRGRKALVAKLFVDGHATGLAELGSQLGADKRAYA